MKPQEGERSRWFYFVWGQSIPWGPVEAPDEETATRIAAARCTTMGLALDRVEAERA